MKKEVLVLFLLLIPTAYSEQCFGNCPQPETFNDFMNDFDLYQNKLVNQNIPEGLNKLLGDQKINVNVNEQQFSIETKNGLVVSVSKYLFENPTLTASMDGLTFTSIMQSENKQASTLQAINNKRIKLEGAGIANKLREFGGRAYSFFVQEKPHVELNPVACLEAEDSAQTIKLKRAGDIKIPEDTELIIPPFKLECERNTEVKLTLSVPKNYREVQVLKCNEDLCLPSYVNEVEFLACGEGLVKVYQEEKKVPLTEVKIPSKEQQVITNSVLQTGNVRIEVLESESILMKAGAASSFPELKNPSLKILGAPLVVNVDKKIPAKIKIELPYITGESIDPDSVSVYSFNNGKWNFLGGAIDLAHEKISVNVELSKYLDENNQAIFSLIGWICEACDKSSLKKIYDPYTDNREAVVFVHGLGSSSAIFQPIIDDIRLTHQPWQVFTFSYPIKSKIQETMIDLADNLEDHLKSVDKIHLVGYDLGGIIVQQSLEYASLVGNYNFLRKAKNAVIIGAPNKGIIEGLDYNETVDLLINDKNPSWITPEIIKELNNKFDSLKVEGINYQVIAGVGEFSGFIEKNDGLISTSSAEIEGVNNLCSNYWELQSSHNDLVSSSETREVVEKIIANDLLDKIDDQAIIGNQKYYDLELEDCFDDKIAVVGKKDLKERTPQVCSCGNGYCGWDENKNSCYQDCGNVLRQEIYCSRELLNTLLVCFILLLFSTFLVEHFVRKINKRHRAFLIITAIASALILVLVLINFLCRFRLLIFVLEILVFAVLLRKLWNLWRIPLRKIKHF